MTVTMSNPFERASETATLWDIMKDGEWHDRIELQSKINRKLDGAFNYINQKGREVGADAGAAFWVTKSRLAARLEFRTTEVSTVVEPEKRAGKIITSPSMTFDGKTLEIDPNNYSTGVVDQMDRYVRSKVIGQDQAVDALVDIYQRLAAEMHDPERPLGNLLFMGPTGSGKTYSIECLADYLYPADRPEKKTFWQKPAMTDGNHGGTLEFKCGVGKDAIIKIDCGEFQEDHSIARIIGAPPGYIGHDTQEKALLHPQSLECKFSPVLNRKVAIVLFDEIEKASPKLFRLMLGILDKGQLRMGDNTMADLRHAIVVMTSNLGAKEINELLRDRSAADLEDAELAHTLAQVAEQAARQKFAPEFFNRIDEIVAFKPLPTDAAQRIVVLELQKVDKRISRSRGAQVFIKYEQSTLEYLMKIGFSAEFGARSLKRAIDQVVVKPISKLLSGGAVKAGDRIRVKADETGTKFYKVQEGAVN